MPPRQQLRRIRLPELDRDVSVLAMNCASNPAIAERQSFDAFYDLGGNAFHVHGEGGETESRRRLGRWMAARRNRAEIVICSQVCHEGWDESAKRELDRLNETGLNEDVTHDLELLETSYLDLAYFSRPPEIAIPQVIEMASRELLSGRVRAFGVRNWSPDQIREANAYARGRGLPLIAAVVTTELSAAVPNQPLWEGYVPFETPMRAVVQEEGLAVWAWVYEQAFRPARSERARVRWESEGNRRLMEEARTVGNLIGLSAEQVGMGWMLRNEFSVVGMVTPGEEGGLSLEELVVGANAELP